MEDILRPVEIKSTLSHDIQTGLDLQESKATEKRPNAIHSITTPEEALDALRSKPDLGTLSKALDYLDPDKQQSFNIKLPGPKAALLVNVLVNAIIPDYWSTLDGNIGSQTERVTAQSQQQKTLLKCLHSVTGLGAILAQLRSLIGVASDGVDKAATLALPQRLRHLLEALAAILGQDAFILDLWHDIDTPALKPMQKMLLWKELTSFLTGGKVPSTAAEASDVLRAKKDTVEDDIWITSSNRYCVWLGENIVLMASTTALDDEGRWTGIAQLLGKSYSLGYTDSIIEVLYSRLLLGESDRWPQLRALLNHLAAHERRVFLYSILRIMQEKFTLTSKPPYDYGVIKGDSTISGGAALIAGILKDSADLTESLVTWLTGSSGRGIGGDLSIWRAALTALSDNQGAMRIILDKSLHTFGDALYIKHTPILQQEATSQILLLAAGCMKRSDQKYLSDLSRSSVYLNAISNRLAASSPRVRFLGMMAGMAISDLVDPPEKRMKFDIDGMDSPDAERYRSLTRIHDTVGDINELKVGQLEKSSPPTPLKKKPKPKSVQVGVPRSGPAASDKTARIISIEEVSDNDEEQVDDLVAYEKPDSDEEDEDEDPTLVQRNKPTAPVYILDLIAGLRETEDYERQRLALVNAAPLIRRKAGFGTEVSEHIEELATLLIGLSDKFEMDKFQELRLQGMIAVVVAQPLKMGQWFSRTFFEGDYSMAQRASILTTLGMSARELAGFKEQDASFTGANIVSENSFPTKKLPNKLHEAYITAASPLDRTVKKLEKLMIQPMAVEAADKLTGPNALKVRTFSSRMEVEKKRKKPIPNDLAKIVAEGFFFPLTGRWWIHLQAYGTQTIQFSPILLTAYLKTLSLILHASGPSTLSLPQMTSEFWDLLLSLRSTSASSDDPTVLEALLFALLTLLDVNEDKRRVAVEHAKELLETQEWAQLVFDRAGGGKGDEEGERVRMLAASVLVRAREVVEKYQRLLVGDMFDF